MDPGTGAPELGDGDEFAGYRIERRLGRGGMGVLYLAVEPGLERQVALKLIAPEAAADEVFARRFAEESRIAASIEHPNVLPIYAAGSEGGVPYIAMRFVSGSDLERRLAREGRLEPGPAVALIAQIGNGLDAIHAAGLVHRDVKPANVLFSAASGEEHAYITDFGLARNVVSSSGLTKTGQFVGTVDYVAPEQIAGGTIDARVDIYALGCLLYKLLVGEVPFPREAEAARLFAHINDPVPEPSLRVAAVPSGLDQVVRRAMEKEPGDRYPSAGDLGRAAVAALSGAEPELPERTVATGAAATVVAPIGGAPPTPPPGRPFPSLAAETRAEKPERGRRPAAIAALAAVGLAALVVALIALSGGGGGSESDGSGTGFLSRAELISQADAICSDSQAEFRRVTGEFPDAASEAAPDVAYSEALTEISSAAVPRFEALRPPSEVRDPYESYVAAQRRVREYDAEALEAAESEDGEAYLAAREQRDAEQPLRHRLAGEVGLESCSADPG